MSGPKWMYMGQVIEDGIYMLKDGELYKCDPRIKFPIAKSVNIVTGKIHYPTNADKLRNMDIDELSLFLEATTEHGRVDKVKWVRWLKQEANI